MDKTMRNLIIGLAILIVLTPLGLLATGETFGEWGIDWLEKNVGYVPPGLGQLSDLWSAPMPDYGVPGLDGSIGSAAGYILSAVVGVALCVGILYLIGKAIARRENSE